MTDQFFSIPQPHLRSGKILRSAELPAEQLEIRFKSHKRSAHGGRFVPSCAACVELDKKLAAAKGTA